jgi:hypothetical protein
MMVARLNRKDYDFCAGEWGDVELSESWASYRAFWTAVLSIAAADNAKAVYYRQSDDDKCLAVEIGEEGYGLDPPPKEYRRELLTAVKRLAAGGGAGVAYRWFVGQLTRSTYRGRIVLETPRGDVHWEAHAFPDGIRLDRVQVDA